MHPSLSILSKESFFSSLLKPSRFNFFKKKKEGKVIGVLRNILALFTKYL